MALESKHLLRHHNNTGNLIGILSVCLVGYVCFERNGFDDVDDDDNGGICLRQHLLVVQELADGAVRLRHLVQRGDLAGQRTLSGVLLLQVGAGQVVNQLREK